MTMLSSSSPVTATTISGGRAIPARSSTWISVASPWSTGGLELRLELLEAVAPLLDSVTSCPIRTSERVRFAPTLPPPATIDVHQARRAARPASTSHERTTSVSVAIAVCVGQTVRRPALGVELRARAGRGRARRRTRCRSASAHLADRRCSCCRRPWRRRRRRPPRSRPRASTSRSMPWPTTNPPRQSRRAARAPPRPRRSHVTSQPSPASCLRDGRADPPAADDRPPSSCRYSSR